MKSILITPVLALILHVSLFQTKADANDRNALVVSVTDVAQNRLSVLLSVKNISERSQDVNLTEIENAVSGFEIVDIKSNRRWHNLSTFPRSPRPPIWVKLPPNTEITFQAGFPSTTFRMEKDFSGIIRFECATLDISSSREFLVTGSGPLGFKFRIAPEGASDETSKEPVENPAKEMNPRAKPTEPARQTN